MIKRLMETPNARGIIIFANEDDIRWDSGRIPSPCLLEALLEGPAPSSYISSSLAHPPFLLLPLSLTAPPPSCPYTFFLLPFLCLVPPRNEPGLFWVEMLQD